ncbi:hypothetical protein SBA6_320002 [Candidatus Sulfopaludibacter sp. SbA6]|nr:hypothetical protein SBA6_320002 [Candidatus Sulfopaludibacter sp. SbA6]
MTHLRKAMLEELQRRNLSQLTSECYVRAVEEFSLYYHVPPDRLGPEQIRQYQAHLFTDRKLDANTVSPLLVQRGFLRQYKNQGPKPLRGAAAGSGGSS